MPMPSRKDVPSSASDLPPKLPRTSEALQRARLLLGNRTKTELTDKSRREREPLLATYPSASSGRSVETTVEATG
jgi:hypothetical protein